jgi:hypothetical protein
LFLLLAVAQMAGEIIKARSQRHQGSEPSSKRLSSALLESRAFLEQMQENISNSQKQVELMKVDVDKFSRSRENISDCPRKQKYQNSVTELFALLEKKKLAATEFKSQHEDAEKAFERANTVIRERLTGSTALNGSGTGADSST